MRTLRFGVVGISGLIINQLIFIALMHFSSLPMVLEGAVSLEIALTSNFFLNNSWTFRAGAPSLQRYLRFQAACLGGSLLALLGLWIGVHFFQLSALLSNIAGGFVGAGWNYGSSVLWTWRNPSGSEDHRP